jgi:hypothetical protein
LTVSPLPNPAALFRAAGAHGVCALQSFSLRAKPVRLSTPATLLPSASAPPEGGMKTRLQGLAPRRSPLSAARGEPCDEPDALLGFESSPGPHATRSASTASSARPPMDFLVVTCSRPQADTTSPPRRPFGVLLDRGADSATLDALPTLLRSSNLVSKLESVVLAAALAHGFTSGPEPRHRALPNPLQATSSSCRSPSSFSCRSRDSPRTPSARAIALTPPGPSPPE